MHPRIVTLTLNPAIDIASSAPVIRPTHKIRTVDEHVDPGGGGVNVARVIHALGGETLALLLLGSLIGHFLDEMLEYAGVPRRSLAIEGRTRVSTTVHDQSTGQEYRFVPRGPVIMDQEWNSMLVELERTDGSWVVASGSLPRGVPDDFYARAARVARRRGQSFALDCSGPAVQAALGSGITLLKQSLKEMEHLVGHALADPHAQEAAALAMVQRGDAEMVTVTLGQDGALLATATGVWRVPALPGVVRSAVGAGDAFLAAMVLALSRGKTPEQALVWGNTAGSVAVAGVGTARVERAAFETLLPATAR